MNDILQDVFSRFDSALIAFSGGVDSALVAQLAQNQYGEKALAVISFSESLARSERDKAFELCQDIGIRSLEIKTNELSDPEYRKNDGMRCFACKTHLYRELSEYSKKHGFSVVMDGANADDLSDYRPGRKAAKNYKVVSPLAEAGMTKQDVRAMARALGLTNWDKPASACLASRVPYGTTVSQQVLATIEQAEEALRQRGFRNFRVRHHGDTARIEVGEAELEKLLAVKQSIVSAMKKAGYLYVSVDLEPFKSGNMNQALMQ